MVCRYNLGYFIAESSTARSQRLTTVYGNPMSEVYLMFYQAVLQLFVHFNLFLQRDDPLIPVLHSEVNGFLKKLLTRFIKVAAVQAVKDDIISTDYGNEDIQLPGNMHVGGIVYCFNNVNVQCTICVCVMSDTCDVCIQLLGITFLDGSLFVGIMTRQLLMKLQQDGDISATDVKRFYVGVRAFYISAVDYAIDNLPLNDTLLKNAEFVYFPKREQATISQVVYFVTRLKL